MKWGFELVVGQVEPLLGQLAAELAQLVAAVGVVGDLLVGLEELGEVLGAEGLGLLGTGHGLRGRLGSVNDGVLGVLAEGVGLQDGLQLCLLVGGETFTSVFDEDEGVELEAPR